MYILLSGFSLCAWGCRFGPINNDIKIKKSQCMWYYVSDLQLGGLAHGHAWLQGPEWSRSQCWPLFLGEEVLNTCSLISAQCFLSAYAPRNRQTSLVFTSILPPCSACMLPFAFSPPPRVPLPSAGNKTVSPTQRRILPLAICNSDLWICAVCVFFLFDLTVVFMLVPAEHGQQANGIS